MIWGYCSLCNILPKKYFWINRIFDILTLVLEEEKCWNNKKQKQVFTNCIVPMRLCQTLQLEHSVQGPSAVAFTPCRFVDWYSVRAGVMYSFHTCWHYELTCKRGVLKFNSTALCKFIHPHFWTFVELSELLHIMKHSFYCWISTFCIIKRRIQPLIR